MHNLTFAFWMTLLAGVLADAVSAVADEPLFPFVVSYDAPDNITNVSSWLTRPAGKDGFVRAGDGHLATDAGPVRFWGTNLCFDACFPSHEQAERVARRLARFGINVVRMHHMDSRSIWGDSPNKLTIDPKQLERLDYLIWQLKQNGVYTNLNLHVSRSLGPAEGFPAQQQRPKYDKGLDNFEPRMIELQKKYARDLLTHVNPYTGQPYSREPAVAFVEINNENALFNEWSRGHFESLPEPYATTFRQQWNEWLVDKYRTTADLQKAWGDGEQRLGDEMLENGDFRRPLSDEWNLERDEVTEVAWSIEAATPGGRPCLRAVVKRRGREPWRPQFSQGGLTVEKGQAYTLAFAVRADRTQRIGINCMMAHEPWQRLGLSANTEVGTEWRRVQFTFIAGRDDDNARITFTGLPPGTYEFATVSLRPGGIYGVKTDERLEGKSVAVLNRGQSDRTPAARRDFIDFLWDTEHRYWTEMYRFLKHQLGVQSLVSGTQLNYSPVHVQAQLDYIDAHAYWQHPRFPARPWDRNDWYVEDVAMVNSPGGTLTSLAARRVAGLPFTVSEYNHPVPNSFGAEGLPMLAAMAAHQSWNGVYSFTWSHDASFEPDRLTGYFDIKSDPAKLVHAPACVAMFVRGDLAAARQTVLVPLSKAAERAKLYETGDPWRLTTDEFGVEASAPVRHGVAFSLTGEHPEFPKRTEANGETSLVSDTGMIHWNLASAGKGTFIVNTPRTKLFTGFVNEREFQLGDVTLRIGATRRDWATVSMTCIDGEGFSQPGRILIAASGHQQNTAAELENLGGHRVTLRNRWGRGPVLCEGIPAEISLPVASSRVTCYALDAAGNRSERVEVHGDADRTQIQLDPKRQTLWYEVVLNTGGN